MNDYLIIDANRKIDPLLHQTNTVSDDALQRVISIAIPFINLNPAAGRVVSVGMGIYHTWTVLTDIGAVCQKGNWLEAAKKLPFLVLVVSSTAFAIIFPFGQFVISNGTQLLSSLYEIFLHLYTQEWEESGKALLRVLCQAIYIASVFTGTPELIALSLIIQALGELSQAYQEFAERGEERLPEIIAHLILGAIRIHSTVPHLRTVHRNHFGKQLTQEQWQEIYHQISLEREKSTNPLIDLEAILIEKNISSRVKEINFERTSTLTHLLFQNMRFQECNFQGVDFEGSRFHRIIADSCLFQSSSWIHSAVIDSQFYRCDLTSASVVASLQERVTYTDSNLSFACFNDSFLNQLSIEACTLEQTSFLGTAVQKSSITDSDLTDCLLLGAKEAFKIERCTPNKITKPIVGLCWNFRNKGIFADMISEALKDNKAIPLRFEYQPDDIDPFLLEIEVQQKIAEIRRDHGENFLSIAAEVIKRAEIDSQIGRLKTKALAYLQYCDGLSLPGGSDIQPEFYGATREMYTSPDADYRRSILEFSLLTLADKHKIPTMGTCRGAQMINVYFGGTLTQHVDGQLGAFKPLDLTDSSFKDWAKALFGDDFLSYSAHHQAIDQLGVGLETVLKADEIPKLAMSLDGNFIASQIHPEIYFSLRQMFEGFYKQFSDKKIELDEMLKSAFRMIEKNQNIYRYFVDLLRRT